LLEVRGTFRIGAAEDEVFFSDGVPYPDAKAPALYELYGRFDLFPQVTLPIRSWPWLSVSVTGGERFTWYGDSLQTTTTDAGHSRWRRLSTSACRSRSATASR